MRLEDGVPGLGVVLVEFGRTLADIDFLSLMRESGVVLRDVLLVLMDLRLSASGGPD